MFLFGERNLEMRNRWIANLGYMGFIGLLGLLVGNPYLYGFYGFFGFFAFRAPAPSPDAVRENRWERKWK